MCVLLYFKKRENIRDTRNNKERQIEPKYKPKPDTKISLAVFLNVYSYIFDKNHFYFYFPRALTTL